MIVAMFGEVTIKITTQNNQCVDVSNPLCMLMQALYTTRTKLIKNL